MKHYFQILNGKTKIKNKNTTKYRSSYLDEFMENCSQKGVE